jgi:hypothetical protein
MHQMDTPQPSQIIEFTSSTSGTKLDLKTWISVEGGVSTGPEGALTIATTAKL